VIHRHHNDVNYYRLRLYRVRLYHVITIILLLFYISPHYAIAYNNAIIQFSAVHMQSIACIYTTMYVYMHMCIMHDYCYCVVIIITSPSTSRIFCLHFFPHIFERASSCLEIRVYYFRISVANQKVQILFSRLIGGALKFHRIFQIRIRDVKGKLQYNRI